MNAASTLETMELAKANEPRLGLADSTRVDEKISFHDVETHGEHHDDGITVPTDEDLKTLRRVAGKIPWTAYTIAFVEMSERFSYYGTTAVFVNFIQQPLPDGSVTGAGMTSQSGALNMGQRASTGLTLFNSFWAYFMPLLGAYMADQYWGRFKTIQVATGVALVGHIILIVSAIPPVIVHPTGAIVCFSIGLVIMGIGVGGFKSNISPLIAEQCSEKVMTVKTTKKGERIIMDPAVTMQRVYLYFYFMVNVGSLVGSIAMVYAEKYVGFWLSFLLPTLVLCLCPMVIYACRNKYNRTPPTGSTISKAMKLIGMIFSQRWSWNPIQCRRNFKQQGVWDSVKPSALGTSKPEWMTFNDAWVDEVRRGVLACKVFLWFPLYWLAYNQMTNNLTSQAATMKLGGVPNDIVNNFNPLFILLLIPVMDRLVYPGLQKMKLQFTPIKRITCGFFIAALAMISACVTQVYIYRMSPCGNHANTCEDEDGNTLFAPISVWVQLLPYGLIGFSELMASVTSLEYAYTKAPANMKSSVQAISLVTSAISSALAQALVSLSDDPLLAWNYGVVAVLAVVGGIAFYLSNMKTDRDDDKLNLLPAAVFDGRVSDLERDIGETSSQDIGRDDKKDLHERV